MGCCAYQLSSKDQDITDYYNNLQPINMTSLRQMVETYQMNRRGSGTPFTDRGDMLVRINRQKFVPTISGDLSEFYEIQAEIGSGSYGKVFRALHFESGSLRAIKTVRKDRIEPIKRSQLYREVEILRQLDHPSIVKAFEIIENEETINIATELCSGGNLFERIGNFPFISENLIASYMYQIVSALIYCHKNRIVHRDVKPENILFESEAPNSSIKLIDFGISTKLEENQLLTRFIGTVYYVAPEVIEGKYNEKCDIWSCGVILYALLSGRAPFNGKSKKEIISKISKGIFTFQDPVWANITKQAKGLIKQMLTKDPDLRPSAEEVFNHPWIQQRVHNLVEDNTLSNKVLTNLANFQGIWKLKEATLNYIVCQMVTNNEINSLRTTFIALDFNGDGKISVEELYRGFEKFKLNDKYNIESILESCDADKNGFIDYTEFLTATINWNKSLSLERLNMAFRAYDTDKNGKLSLNEVKEFIGDESIPDDIWERMFEEADINRDGYIDIEEFQILMRAV